LKYPTLVLVFIIVLIAFYFFSLSGQGKSENEVSVEQVKQMIAEADSLVLLDVRTVLEFNGSLGHIEGSILLPLAELDSRMNELEKYKDWELIVICTGGSRSGQATQILRDNEFEAFNMQGGMLAWNAMLETTKQDTTGGMNETNAE